MATLPGILTGSSNKLKLFRSIGERSSPESNSGVFGPNPGATPKYSLNSVGSRRDAEYRETMARLFVEIPPGKLEAFLTSVTPETRPLARVLATGGEAGGGGGTGFIDFLLERTQETLAEKAQITDTLTDNFVAYYSGQTPPVFRYQGTLLNTYQDDQRVWMLRLYREILRGSRLAVRGLTARLRYDSFLVTGYLENLSLTLDGSMATGSNFSFDFRVKRLSVITAMLGAPTVVQTPATENNVINGGAQNDAENERVGVVTSEEPDSASALPAAEGTPLTSAQKENVRSTLRASGLSDAEIDVQIAASEATGQSLSVDGRETEYQSTFEGTSRVFEQVQGGVSNPELVNPENVTNDGFQGTTNIRSQGNELQSTPSTPLYSLQPRQSRRRRGRNQPYAR